MISRGIDEKFYKENLDLIIKYIGWDVSPDKYEIKPNEMLFIWMEKAASMARYLDEPETRKDVVEYLKFNVSYDWLMPIIDKIENTNQEKIHNAFSLRVNGKHYMKICYYKTGLPIVQQRFYNRETEVFYTRREVLFRLIVKYIKWYNRFKDKLNLHNDWNYYIFCEEYNHLVKGE